jgi:2-polyprenyl-3-methyl-5-hydroxy-6-metoxy-1,4-benzoquinol methylase
MLEAHPDQTHDGASRRSTEVEKTVHHLIASGLLKTGDRIHDLGCGPGLYSSRLCVEGIKVTGIDLSQTSIDYAGILENNRFKVEQVWNNLTGEPYREGGNWVAIAARKV